ncbi:ROK family transcriptional regulator [Microlunatus parietis]
MAYSWPVRNHDGGHPMRRDHEERVIAALRDLGPLSRAELAQRVGISRTTMSDITNHLLNRAMIVTYEPSAESESDGPAPGSGPSRRGRPASRLALNPRAGQLLGIDFGHRRVHVVVVDAAHRMVASEIRRYPSDSDWPTRVAEVLELLRQLGRRADVELSGLSGIGVGFPGPFSPRMPTFDSDDHPETTPSEFVRNRLRDHYPVPIMIDNNTRLAGLAEAVWGGAETDHLVYVRLSDGIGGGLVIGGRLVTGADGFAGELGHVSVRLDGPDCRCGKRGCLETIASVPAILARCQELGARVTSLSELRTAVERADPLVDRVLRDAGDALGRVLGTMAVTLNPSEIVVGGEIVQHAPQLLSQAQIMINWELQSMAGSELRLRPASLGDEDGALGAVAALLHTSPLLANYPVPGTPSDDDHRQAEDRTALRQAQDRLS